MVKGKISKDDLKGKYVSYLDSDGKYRIHKVIKINGNNLTVVDVNKVRHRIHPDTNKIFGRQFPKKGLEEIIWNKPKKKK